MIASSRATTMLSFKKKFLTVPTLVIVQGRVVITPRPGVAKTPRPGVAIISGTRNWSGNDFYNTKYCEIGAGMTFITPSTPKSTCCYNHPLM